MLTNGSIQRIDAPAAAGPQGTLAWTTGPAVAIDALIDEPTTAQLITLGATLANITAICYVPEDAWGGNAVPVKGGHILACVGSDAAILYEVMHAAHWVKDGGLSHYQFALKARS